MKPRDVKYFDITGKIGPLFLRKGEPEWPMYSYDRPAYLLWNAIAKEWARQGYPDESIKCWLQSKCPRWELDGNLGEMITKTGRAFARRINPTIPS